MKVEVIAENIQQGTILHKIKPNYTTKKFN